MIKGRVMRDTELVKISKQINLEELSILTKLVNEEEIKWKNLKADFLKKRKHFIIEGGHGGYDIEYYHHIIHEVRINERCIICADLSLPEERRTPTVITWIPDAVYTEEEFNEKYT